MKSVPSAIRVADQSTFSGVTAVGSFPLPSPSRSSTGSMGVGSSIQQTLTPATTMGSLRAPHVGTSTPPPSAGKRSSTQDSSAKGPTTHPSEWSVEEVVEWLKAKGFDQGVCDKFIEQEITGDVLLELDANVLKSEIGILAFGKRARIVNAINDLKRPPSISDSEHMSPASLSPGGGMGGVGMGGGLGPLGLPPLIATSRSHSVTYSHSHSASMQSSTHHSFNNNNSPLAFPASQSLSPAYSNTFTMPVPNSPGALPSAGLGSMLSNDSSPMNGDFPGGFGSGSGLGRNGWRASDPGSIHHSVLDDEKERETMRSSTDLVGLGVSGASPEVSPTNGKIGVCSFHRGGFLTKC